MCHRVLDWDDWLAEVFEPAIGDTERAVHENSCWHDGWRR